MKIKVNRNILWTESFIKVLSDNGIKYACISPGSRNTPLTYAAASNKKIISFVHLDERSSAFFALGLAKAAGMPVILICTSGTATAEFYPAIIEAYQQHAPLIVCTADRPPELKNCGANQTINQDNIYKNHIRWYTDAGLPSIDKLPAVIKCAGEALTESRNLMGPVHINFPFDKPFEPHSYTDEVEPEFLNILKKEKLKINFESRSNILNEEWFNKILRRILRSNKGLILAGPEEFTPGQCKSIERFSRLISFPVLADGASNLRFGTHRKNNIISNYEGFLRSEHFVSSYKPDLLIHFGRTMTSKAIEDYLEKIDSYRILVNDFGEWFNPSNKQAVVIKCRLEVFCDNAVSVLGGIKKNHNSKNWLNSFIQADRISASAKKEIIENAPFPLEPGIVKEIITALPDNVNLMISNSLPIRDFDYFASITEKKVNIFVNRGASGIDGITSTALGIAAGSKTPTVLLTGDMAFYHDLNGLLAAKKYSIPLIIVLINNNGGGIFKVLPIAEYGSIYNKFFNAAHDLSFIDFTTAYGGSHSLIKSPEHFHSAFKSAMKRKNFSVLEINTNSSNSLRVRKKFWRAVDKLINKSL